MIDIPQQKFPLGRLVGTPDALAALEDSNESPWKFLLRHGSGDWGEVDEEDRLANEDALQNQGRLFSVCKTARGVTLWCITEHDRSSTCLLLPKNY
jgi:hypothetical protein